MIKIGYLWIVVGKSVKPEKNNNKEYNNINVNTNSVVLYPNASI